jgi:phosphonate transport system substrate-binding protein
LQPGKDVTVRIAGNHVNAVQRMLAGEAAAAIVTRTSLKQMEPALAARVKIVLDLPKALSPVVFSVAPALADKAPALGRRLIEFVSVDPVGKAFIESLAFLGLAPVGRELEQADPLVVEFYRQLGQAD